VRVGVIGCGYWGPNLVRNFSRKPESAVIRVCDLEFARARRVAEEFGISAATVDPEDVFADRDVDLVVVATPGFTHYELARRAIETGKHVLVMKPFTTSTEQGEELCSLAEREGVLLAVDHTFIFTGAVRKMKSLIDSGEIGELYYFDSVRINLGLIQHDVNVIWDLGPHDVSIMDHLIGQDPISVQATAAAHGGSPTENIAYMSVEYGGSLLGHVHVNWLAPAKIRRTIVGGSKRMLVFDDMEPSEKIRVYDKGFTMNTPSPENDYRALVSYRSGDMHAPRIDTREALAVETENVIGSILGREKLVVDGAAGVRVVRILEAAQRSLDENGASIGLQTALAT
jgi:predicted dehydrogenase